MASSSDERTRILKMVEDGKLTPEEGAQLLQSLGADPEPTPTASDADTFTPGQDKSRRWFRIRVTDTQNGKPQVNLRIPVSLLRVGLKIGARFAPEVDKLDVEELTRFLNSNEPGPVIDVNEDDGQHVEIYVE